MGKIQPQITDSNASEISNAKSALSRAAEEFQKETRVQKEVRTTPQQNRCGCSSKQNPPVIREPQPQPQPTPPVIREPQPQPTPPVAQEPQPQPTPPVAQEPKYAIDQDGKVTITSANDIENDKNGAAIYSSGAADVKNTGDNVTINTEGGYGSKVTNTGDNVTITGGDLENNISSSGDNVKIRTGNEGGGIIVSGDGKHEINTGEGVDFINLSGNGINIVESGGGGDALNGKLTEVDSRNHYNAGTGSDIIETGDGKNYIRDDNGSGDDYYILKKGKGEDSLFFGTEFFKDDGNKGNGNDFVRNFDASNDKIIIQGLSDEEERGVDVVQRDKDVVIYYKKDGIISSITFENANAEDVKGKLILQ